MAESDELITLRSEVEALRMIILQLQQERGGAGGPAGGFFPIGDFRKGGSGAAIIGNFEPMFSEGKISNVHGGFYPFGRRFIFLQPQLDESAKISDGNIYLEITHVFYDSTGDFYGSEPTVLIKGGDSIPANNSRDKTNIPLYKIAGGKIYQDYRSVMSLPIREL